MKKIPEAGNKNPNIPKVTIEHWYPRNPQNQSNEEQGLNYRNMFAVCSGNRGCGNEDNMTCDAHRKNEILKVKPSDVNTLYGIIYTSDGYIKSSDEHINNDLNQKLNLNCISSSLPENRKQALNELIKYVQNNHPQGDISLFCKRKLQQLQNINDPKPPFVGILLWWLERKANRS